MKVEISSNQAKLNSDSIHRMLSKVSWSPGITENEILKGINNSALVVAPILRKAVKSAICG